jgi:hypothetical protein
MPTPDFKIAGAYVELFSKGDLGKDLQKANNQTLALGQTLGY